MKIEEYPVTLFFVIVLIFGLIGSLVGYNYNPDLSIKSVKEFTLIGLILVLLGYIIDKVIHRMRMIHKKTKNGTKMTIKMKQTYKQLEKNIWMREIAIILIVIITFIFLFILDFNFNKQEKELSTCQADLKQILTPEVINGNFSECKIIEEGYTTLNPYKKVVSQKMIC